ncbi:MAG: UDP-N-acetylmuramoyl-tripeptide--D-alanyl-D-alanine ligase [Gammaproteobacteria bacterium]
MHMQLSDISACLGGALNGSDVAVSAVSIDTRTLQRGDLYVAIKGENFDGNDFVAQAEQAGAAAALLQRKVDTGLPVVHVADTRLALGELAKIWRRKAAIPVVGVTGSNGKTTVKEMIAAILGGNADVLFTKGNLNNEIGVPLTLLRLQDAHRYAVIEMGANHPGEIRYTASIAQPDVALINNVGAAHIEGFGDIDGVAAAKGELVQSLGVGGIAVLNADDAYFEYWQTLAAGRQIVSFGLSGNADVTASQIRLSISENRFVTEFTLHYAGQCYPLQLQLAGRHNVSNALAASAACLALGVEAQQIRSGLAKVLPVTGRLQPLSTRQGNLLIDDTYNANPASLHAALQVLQQCPGEAWVILGAFGELGPESPQMHAQMGETIKRAGVKRLFATGVNADQTVRAFGNGAEFFNAQTDLIAALQAQLMGREAVLIKGSRAQKMERVAQALVDNFRI